MFEPLSDQDRQDWQLYIDQIFNSPSSGPLPVKEPQYLRKRLDLHGMTVSEAHGKVNNFFLEHLESQTESAVVITGKSGQISHEFQDWCKQIKGIRKVEPIIDSRGGIGSYRIWFKKTRVK